VAIAGNRCRVKTSQHGCRVDLDADPSTPGIQPFPAGATIRFSMCAQTNPDPHCEFVWSSDPSQNPDGFDHLRTTQLHPAEFPGKIDEPTARRIQNHAPTARAGADQTVECSGPGVGTVRLDGSASSDPDGEPLSFTWFGEFGVLGGPVVNAPLSLGTHTVLLMVSDGNGASGTTSATLNVTVRDTTAPTLTVALSRTQLWPPNHRLVPIDATIAVSDVCSASPRVVLDSITSNEPGTDDIQSAAFGTDDRSFLLRAERLGNGTGRVYTVTYRAVDGSGNTTVQRAEVRVPHDQGH
jgi:hypothetical protein